MADASVVTLSEGHSPKQASLEAFEKALPDIRNVFHKARLHWEEHSPHEMFVRVEGYSDHQLLEPIDVKKDVVQVKTGETAYGLHLFGKLRVHGVDDAFIHVRLFVTEETVKVHAIQTDEHYKDDQGHTHFTAIFREKDVLEWFNE